ncbi:MAG: hypothetical protein Q4Q06_01565 [Bacteroidota bacterium]|nr:hypothetical protein [Bacteroidota bacterium]
MKYNFIIRLLAFLFAIFPTLFSLAQTKNNAYAYVTLDTVFLKKDTLDLSLVFYMPHNCKVSFTNQRPDSNSMDISLSVAAAFTASNLKDVVGDYVVRGTLYKNKTDVETGICLILKDTIIIDSIHKAPFYKSMAQKNKGYYFQQMLILKDGDTVECTIFRKQKPTFRRALVIYNGKGVVVESVNRLSFENFANTLKEMGIKDAIYLDMGTWSEGFVRLKDRTLFSIGHLKYNTKRQTNWLRYIYHLENPASTKAIRTNNRHHPHKK